MAYGSETERHGKTEARDMSFHPSDRELDNEIARLQAEARAQDNSEDELAGPLAAIERADRSHSPLRIIVAIVALMAGLLYILLAIGGYGSGLDRLLNVLGGALFVYWSVLAFERKRRAYNWGMGISGAELVIGGLNWASGSHGPTLVIIAVLLGAGVWFSRDTFDRE